MRLKDACSLIEEVQGDVTIDSQSYLTGSFQGGKHQVVYKGAYKSVHVRQITIT